MWLSSGSWALCGSKKHLTFERSLEARLEAHTCHLSTWEARQGDCRVYEPSVSYIVRPCLKKKKNTKREIKGKNSFP